MTTSSAMARELSVLLGARIGSAEVPHVSVEMRALSTGWLVYARHRGDEVEAQCSTSDLNYPPEVFQDRVLGPIAHELARLYARRVTAHIRAGLNPYRPGKMAEVRKPRRVKNAQTSPGPWSEPRKLKPAEFYQQGHVLHVAPEEMPLPDGARFLPPADKSAEPLITVKPLGEELYWLGRAHMQREGEAFGRDLDERVMASLQAAPVDYSGHWFDPDAISRAAGAGMQAAQRGRPHLPPEYAWMADQPKRFPWDLCIGVAVLAALFGTFAFRVFQHWNP